MSDPDLWDAVLNGGVEESAPPLPPQKKEEEVPEMGVSSPAGAEEDEWVPFLMGNDTDISAMTDDQIEDCFALAPPSWVRIGADLQPTTENISRLGKAFVGKRNPVPIRRPGKTWHAEHRELTKEDFVRHLTGKWLLGAYLLDDQDTTGVAVCDIDAEGSLKAGMLSGRYYPVLDMAYWARAIGDALSVALGSAVHVTLTGGKGAHAICVLPERAPAAIVRRQLYWMCVRLGLVRAGLQWAHESGDFFVEPFPKQDEAGTGLGNLIRLPNGTDPGMGRKCLVVVDEDCTVTEDTSVQPMYRVNPTEPEHVSRREIQRLLDEGESLDWLKSFLGDDYTENFQRRCEGLMKGTGVQMRNALGQAIHMAGWWSHPHATGLITELEAIQQGGNVQ